MVTMYTIYSIRFYGAGGQKREFSKGDWGKFKAWAKRELLKDSQAWREAWMIGGRQGHSSNYSINYSSNDFNQGIRELFSMLPSFTSLEKLEMQRFDISKEWDIGSLSRALPSLTSLKELQLSNCNIGDKGMQELSKALPSLTALEYLNLEGNKISDEAAMLMYMSLDKGGRRSNQFRYIGAPNINSWQAYDISKSKFKPSREFSSFFSGLWFGVQCLVFLSDAILDIVTTITLWKEGNQGWGALMLFLYLLPAIMAVFEEGVYGSPLWRLMQKVTWFLGTATQILPIYYMRKSFGDAQEKQEYVRSNARQVVYESIPQSWLQFYIFLRQFQLRCEAQQPCSFGLSSSTQLLLVSFAFSILSTAWQLGSMQWVQMGHMSDNIGGNAFYALFKDIWQQAMQVHMLHFVFEATSRMATMGMLGLVLRGWPAFFVLLGMFLVRFLLLSFGPVFPGSSKRMWRSLSLLLSKSVQTVASAYFCDAALWMNRACVLLSAVEGIVAIALFVSSEQNIPKSFHTVVVMISSVCTFIATMGMLVRPFPTVKRPAEQPKANSDELKDVELNSNV